MSTLMSDYSSSDTARKIGQGVGIVVFIVFLLIAAGMWIFPAYGRYQDRQNENNIIALNELKIQQTMQLVAVEQQKAQIRIVEANGISAAQRIINSTLTDKYLQHEAIGAQEKMANSPNHTTIYIPSGENGIPIVRTVNEELTPPDPPAK